MMRFGNVTCYWLLGVLFAVSSVVAETVMINAIQDTTIYDTPAGNLSNGAGTFTDNSRLLKVP